MWYIYTVEYHSSIKRKEIVVFAATWMDLEIIVLSEVSQTGRHQYHMLSLTCGMLKEYSELLCRTDTDSQTLKTKGNRLRGGVDGLGVWMEMLYNWVVMIIVQL